MNRQKIDQFTIILAVALIFCAGMLIFTFRTIFNAVTISYDTALSDVSTEKIDMVKFEQAKNFAFGEKVVVPVSRSQSAPVIIPSTTVTPTPLATINPQQ